MIGKISIATLVSCQLIYANTVNALTQDEAVDSLAQGCYLIKSPGNGRYVKQYHSGGAINDGENFAFYASNADDADRFFIKPTMAKHFMLTNQTGRYLASTLPAQSSAGKWPGSFAEWGKFIYAITHIGLLFYFCTILAPEFRRFLTNFSSRFQLHGLMAGWLAENSQNVAI